MKNILTFLKECGTFYLATNEDNQPRVRPFGAVSEFEGKLYIVTNNKKNVFNQMIKNPKIEISGTIKDKWIRVEGTAVKDDNSNAKEKMLADNPVLSKMYSADDEIMEVFYIKDGSATFYSFTEEPKEIKF